MLWKLFGRTDGQGKHYIPPTSLKRGYNKCSLVLTAGEQPRQCVQHGDECYNVYTLIKMLVYTLINIHSGKL